MSRRAASRAQCSGLGAQAAAGKENQEGRREQSSHKSNSASDYRRVEGAARLRGGSPLRFDGRGDTVQNQVQAIFKGFIVRRCGPARGEVARHVRQLA